MNIIKITKYHFFFYLQSRIGKFGRCVFVKLFKNHLFGEALEHVGIIYSELLVSVCGDQTIFRIKLKAVYLSLG